MHESMGRFGLRYNTSLVRGSRLQHAPRPRAATAVAAANGPMGPSPAKNKPDWVRILEEDAAVDDEIAELLRGTDGDPDKIRAKMEEKLRSPYGSSGSSTAGQTSSSPSSNGPGVSFETRTGSDAPPEITFQEVDPFDLWVWLEFIIPPAQREKELLQSTLQSWFVVGKLGGFNSQNMQVYYNNSDDNSFLEYDSEEASSALTAFMHSVGDPEFKGSWARFHVDLGTADELAFDVLINMLVGFSFEVAGIARIRVGGEHERWELPPRANADDEDADGWEGEGQTDGRAKRQHGEAPKVGINPMKLPSGVEEELEMLDELGMLYDQQQQQQQPQQPQQQPDLQQQQQQQPQRREWGKGLKSLGGSAAAKGRILAKQQPQQQQQPQQPPAAPSINGSSSSRSKSQRAGQLGQLRKRQQYEEGGAGPGMSVYSEEEFKRAFGVVGEDE